MSGVGGLRGGRKRTVRVWQTVSVAGFAVMVAHLGTGLGGRGLDVFVDRWLYDALELSAAAGCLLRVVWIPRERAAWLLLAVSVLSFSVGDICFDFVYGGAPPTPSLADLFYLLFYPGCYAGLLLLVRARIARFSRSVWLDGLIAALASAAIGASIIFQVVLETTKGRALTVTVDLAYPLGDVLLVGVVVFAVALTGWRPGREWLSLAAAFAAISVADSIYLALNAAGGYHEGTLLDALWPGSLLLLAAAAWQSPSQADPVDMNERLLGAAPIGFGFAALLLLLVDSHIKHLNLLASGLAVATIATVLIRLALAFRENRQLLLQTTEHSLTDALTGLGNRRKLMSDLAACLSRPPLVPYLFLILDLNGFKGYNDRFGHPSGDKLLARLGGKLAVCAGRDATAYRLGGDEFCLLARFNDEDGEALIHAATEALKDIGEGFSVTASFGGAILPDEAADASAALRVADERLYTQKTANLPVGGDSYEVLLRALTEREPTLGDHVRGVADLSVSVGEQLGLANEALSELRLAAELHDVGKLAIPDDILRKPGPLNAEEQEFMRQHTLIGQRILAGSPALKHIGEIVRSTHERWDGDGYNDRIGGEHIPLAARIIAVCDAYAAMVNDRPYRPATTHTEAIAELRRCSGTQFDPKIVHQFCLAIEKRRTAPALNTSAAEQWKRLSRPTPES
jgi:diguanylate cyclase (GGDEF)-like protein